VSFLARCRRGYSMLEMLTVLLIVVIVAGLASTSLLIVSHRRALHMDVRQVRTTLVKARTLARATQRCVQVVVGSHSLTVTPYDDCGPPLASPDPSGTTTVELVPTVSLNAFSTGSSALIFDEYGSVDAEGPVELHMVTNAGELTYRIYPAIGTVRVLR